MSDSTNGNLPPNWAWSTIGTVLDGKVDQYGPPKAPLFTYVDISSIDNLAKRIVSPKLLGRSDAPSRARQLLRAGDVLVSMTRPNLNAVALVPSELGDAIGSTGFDVLRTSVIEPCWLFHAVQTDDFIHAMCRVVQGALYPAVRPKDVRSYVLAVPPLNEQRRIVAKLDELFSDLDAGVAALERVKANLKRYRASVLKAAVEGRLTESWRAQHRPQETGPQLLQRILKERRRKWEEDQLAAFAAAGKQPPKNWQARYNEPASPDTSNLPRLPEGWCWASVDQVGEVQGGIQKQPKRRPVSNSYAFLRVANVLRDRLDLSKVHRIELFARELDRLRLVTGDILIVEGNGSKTEIGRSAIWQGEIKDCVHQNHIIRVRFLAGPPRFFNAYWNSPSGNARVMERAASTSGLYTLSVSKVCNLPIPLPPLAEQERILLAIERRLSIAEFAEQNLSVCLLRSPRLRQSILKRAFEGKLVAQDPADEPAAALLARIQQSRVASTPVRARGKQPSDEFLRRAAIVSYTVKRLASQPSFGRTQLEKTLHLAQSYLGIDLGLEFERYAAGPFDKSIYRLEGTAKKSGWFTKQERRRYGVIYQPGPKIDAMCQQAARLLGDKQADFDHLLDHIAAMNTDEAELFSTAYAAWNDLLIDGRAADNAAIIAEIYGWHESKKMFARPTIRKRLEWMREEGYVPTGQGRKTIRLQSQAAKSAEKRGARRK